MKEFIKLYGTLILAIYGIIQIWIIALWKKIFCKGKIEIYETGNIEIGYSSLGPTIGLNGTIRALNKDVFIKSIDLLIVREKDKAQHVFKWFAFRPPKIDLAGSQSEIMEIPASFLVSSGSPHRYNMVFNDNSHFEDVRQLFNEYISEWYKTTKQIKEIREQLHEKDLTVAIIKKTQENTLIENFRKSAIYVKIYSALDRKCYWEAGAYQITINIFTSTPNNKFSYQYEFSINEDDAKNLKLNVITILEDPISNFLRIKNYPYQFAYSEYKD